MKPYYQDDHCTIYHGDCREILPALEPVDLVLTSPPYWKQRKYEINSFDWIESVARSLPKCNLNESGQILVNLGLIHIDGEVFPYWNYLIDEMKAKGWRWFGQYIWKGGDSLPGEWNGRLAPNFEFIFHFNKNAIKLNKTEKSKSFEYGGKIHGKSMADKNGNRANSQFSDGKPVNEFKIQNAIIEIQREVSRDSGHPARFPLKLPKKIISVFPGETILDPFMGSGTTLRAAKDLNRRAIGIEISEKYCEIAANRLKQEVLNL